MNALAHDTRASAPGSVAQALASPALTVAALAVFAVLVTGSAAADQPMTWPVAGPAAVLALNLAAAIATRPAFRRQAALLAFHVALLLMALLFAAGRLCYLRGTAEVTVGAEFSGLIASDAGPWHGGRIDRVRFVNEGFDIAYHAGRARDTTRNRIRWLDESGTEQVGEFGDNQPLVIHGYRFYPTTNKGFAPIYRWLPNEGAPVRGGIHLPAWPANDARQSLEWSLPGSDVTLWSHLDFNEDLLPTDAPATFRTPRDYTLVMRRGEERWTMRPGERYVMPGGTLIFEGLNTWMGYRVFYDWTLPWLLATGVVATLSLFLHFWNAFFRRPW